MTATSEALGERTGSSPPAAGSQLALHDGGLVAAVVVSETGHDAKIDADLTRIKDVLITCIGIMSANARDKAEDLKKPVFDFEVWRSMGEHIPLTIERGSPQPSEHDLDPAASSPDALVRAVTLATKGGFAGDPTAVAKRLLWLKATMLEAAVRASAPPYTATALAAHAHVEPRNRIAGTLCITTAVSGDVVNAAYGDWATSPWSAVKIGTTLTTTRFEFNTGILDHPKVNEEWKKFVGEMHIDDVRKADLYYEFTVPR